MSHRWSVVAGHVAVVLWMASPVAAQIQAQLVVSGLTNPVAFVQDPSQTDVQFIVEQTGHIRVLKDGAIEPSDFLDLSAVVTFGGEEGLLGLAFAPDYATSHRFYVNFINTSGNTVVARFTRLSNDPLHADPTSRFDLVWPGGVPYIAQPYSNHKGGNLEFGPDGDLYLGMGDGGSEGDPLNNGQNPMTLLGKMLRIDVSGPDSSPTGYVVPSTNPFVGRTDVLNEIWDFGVRNPWRWSFDDPSHGGTGALVIGDVGQDMWEEVDYEPAAHGGVNYGWRDREGANNYNTTDPPFFLPLTDPIYEYSHAVGNAVMGGVVYRGSALGSTYRGRYFFADYVTAHVWSLGLTINPLTGVATVSDVMEHTSGLGPAATSIVAFGVDAAGELYVVNYPGTVYRLVPPSSCSTPDPFTVLGGGTCVNGGWLPPGISSPSNSGNQSSTPPSQSSGTCSIPDPFTVLGGGTCVNGGWLPPGVSPPSSGGNQSSTPPQSSGTCSIPDPFTAIGGGTCVNGGWLPPGISPPSSGGSQSSTPPAQSSGTCSTPDPFTVLGGGTCANGGWLPPGITAPPSPPPPPSSGGCTTSDPFASIPGLHGVCANGGWTPVQNSGD